MRSVVIAYIVVQVVFAIIAAIAVIVVIQGQKKPTCEGQCKGKIKSVTGTQCSDLKPLGSDKVEKCNQKCPSDVKWVAGCTGEALRKGESSFCWHCVALKGSPGIYWGVAVGLLVIPLIVFFPFIFKKTKRE